MESAVLTVAMFALLTELNTGNWVCFRVFLCVLSVKVGGRKSFFFHEFVLMMNRSLGN